MKKKFLAVVAAVVAAVATFAFTGCKSANAEKNILVVTREDGSGNSKGYRGHENESRKRRIGNRLYIAYGGR